MRPRRLDLHVLVAGMDRSTNSVGFLDGPKHELQHDPAVSWTDQSTNYSTTLLFLGRTKARNEAGGSCGGREREFLLEREEAFGDVHERSPLAWTTMRQRTRVFASHEARGLRAVTRRSDPRDVEKVVRNLERRSKAVDLRETEKLPALWGKWKLLYSNALPGGPTGTSSDVVGDVFQVIYEGGERVDHEVQFNLGNRSLSQGTTSWSLDNALPSGAVAAVLKHKCKIDVPRTVTITLEKVELGIGDLHVELPTLPEFLQPPDWTRSSAFDITYLDDELRVTRGDRGELRVFLREG